MPSTYSTLGHIELPAPGEQRDLWGAIINRSLTLIEDMIAGITEISTNGSATYIVSEVMGGADTSRNAILLCNGALIADLVVQVPNVSHIYHVRNQTTGGFVVKIKTQTGAALTVPQGYSALVHVDDPGNSDSVFFLTPPTTATTGMPLVSGATLADGDYGDIIASGSGTVLTIDSGAVSNGKLATMAATTLKGNATGGAASPTDLTVPDVKTLLAYTAADVGAQPADADLTTWAGLTPSANAQSLVTAADYAAMRALLDLEAGTDFLSPAAVSAAISAYAQPLDATLTALAAYSTNGLLAQTAADTFVGRTLTGAANEVSVANGDGVAGNPTVSLPAAMTFTGKTITGGTYTSPAAITGLPDPTSAQDAATKAYVDSVAAGLDVKPSAILRTDANITLSGEQTIQTITTSASIVMVSAQSTQAQNGLYRTSAGAWTRIPEMDNWLEVPGAFVFVERGTYADTGWVCTADAGGTLGTTAITWSQFSGAGTYTATGGVTLTGTQFSITTGGIQDFMFRDSTALSVLGRAPNSVGAPTNITAGAIGQVLRLGAGPVLAFGALDLASANAITGDLPFANLTQGSARSVLGVAGNATADVASIQGTADQVLRVDAAGTGLGFGTIATNGIAADAVTYAKMQNISATQRALGRNTAGAGDTEEVTYSQILDWVGSAAHGDILYRGASTWDRLAAGTSGHFLKTQGAGANPTWVAIPGGGDALVSNPLSQFASTTSAQLAGVLSDETGFATGAKAVFSLNPTLLNDTDNASVNVLTLEGDRATPANGDELYIRWVASDSAGNQTEIGRETADFTTATNGAGEESRLVWSTRKANALTDIAQLTSAMFGPAANDGAALGSSGFQWADAYLALGARIYFNGSTEHLRHGIGSLTVDSMSLSLANGTTTLAPLILQPGTSLTAATAGAVEYDGDVMMFTPLSNERGIVPAAQFFRLSADLAGANATGNQNVFGKSVTLSADTVYGFEIAVSLAKTAGTTSHTLSMGFGGTATFNDFFFNTVFNNAAVVPGNGATSFIYNGYAFTNIAYRAATTVASTESRARFCGTIAVNAGGTFNLVYALSAAPGGAYSTKAGSYFKIYPIGDAGQDTNVGTWA